jgi:hypothetical protein
VLQALNADERATLWRLLSRALYAAEPSDDDASAKAVYSVTTA